MKISRLALRGLPLAAALFPTAAPAALLYSVTDLGTLGGTRSYGFGVNDAGQVTGYSYLPGDVTYHAFIYRDGMMTEVPRLNSFVSMGYAINEAGEVTGGRQTAGGFHAFLYDPRYEPLIGSVPGVSDLGTLGGAFSAARGINDAGQVTGYSDSINGGSHAFLYSDGVMIDLGTFGGTLSAASGINDAGQVTGGSQTAEGATHAFLYSGGMMTDLGTLGGTHSGGAGINDAGQMTGRSQTTEGATHAFLYSGGVMSDLGTLGGTSSEGAEINDAGQVVGYASTTGNMAQHAFLYSAGIMADLNDLIDPALGWVLTSAQDISGSGQIVGSGTIGGQTHAFLLTPLAAVPEPATWAMMIVGFAAVGGAMRRRHSALHLRKA